MGMRWKNSCFFKSKWSQIYEMSDFIADLKFWNFGDFGLSQFKKTEAVLYFYYRK